MSIFTGNTGQQYNETATSNRERFVFTFTAQKILTAIDNNALPYLEAKFTFWRQELKEVNDTVPEGVQIKFEDRNRTYGASKDITVSLPAELQQRLWHAREKFEEYHRRLVQMRRWQRTFHLVVAEDPLTLFSLTYQDIKFFSMFNDIYELDEDEEIE